MSPQLAKQAASLLREAATALRGVEKTATVKDTAPSGPVINLAQLRSLLDGRRK